jgi:hypothetical protein
MEQSHSAQHSQGEHLANAARRLPAEKGTFHLQRKDAVKISKEIRDNKHLPTTRHES